MRAFNYLKYASVQWDNEVLNYISLIHEFKGRQEMLSDGKLAKLERLVEVAKVQSVEASNRIEGIVTTASRMGQIVSEKTMPKTRDEKEIAGYRDVLNTIHESYAYIPVTGDVILQLHRDLMRYAGSGFGGKYRFTQNYLKETLPDGTEFVRFTPVPPYEVPACINAICENYRLACESQSIDPLLIIPVFIHDFLCIHPFNDGNGHMSRLLTLLLLYKAGFQVGKYISVEKHIEKTKAAYYDALEYSSRGWHEENDEPIAFIKYMLGVILACYRDFEQCLEIIGETNSEQVRRSAIDTVKQAVDSILGKFTKQDIVNICPSISKKTVEAALNKLLADGYITKHGAGRNTYYAKN